MPRARLFACLLVLACPTAPSQDAPAPVPTPGRFDPEAHFPPRAILYASISSLDRLVEGMSRTLWGRMLTHPGVKRAFAGLWQPGAPGTMALEEMERELEPIRRALGLSPLEIAQLLHGEVALGVEGIGPTGRPSLALAIELGEARERIVGLLARLEAMAEEEGVEARKAQIEGIEATVWPEANALEVAYGVVGTHLVVASTSELLGRIANAYRSGSSKAPWVSELAPRLRVASRDATIILDIALARQLALAMAGDDDANRIVSLLGLDGVGRVGLSFGFGAEGSESATHLELSGKPRGLFGLIRAALPQLPDLAPFLAVLPASSHDVAAVRVAPGDFLRGLDQLLREALPEAEEGLGDAYDGLRSATGISVEDDLWTLGPLTLVSAGVPPPAGGLLSDTLTVARTEDLAPYRRLGDKVMELLGLEPERVELDGAAADYVTWGAASGDIVQRMLSGGFVDPPQDPRSLLQLLALLGGTTASARLEGGWTVLSNLPQAILRYRMLADGAGGPSARAGANGAPAIGLQGEVGPELSRAAAGASCAFVSSGGGWILSGYNTLLSLASFYSGLARGVGVDLAHLPPAEVFLGAVRPSRLRLVLGEDGFTLETRRALESPVALLGGVAVVAMAAGFLVPTLSHARVEAKGAVCLNHLRQLGRLGVQWAVEHDGEFPRAAEDPLAPFRQLIEGDDQFPLELLVCPESFDFPAVRAVDGSFELNEENTSYAFVPWALKAGAPGRRLLLFEKGAHHGGRRNVAYSDGSCVSLQEEDFQDLYRQEAERATGEDDGR